jgi:hypothetical protein
MDASEQSTHEVDEDRSRRLIEVGNSLLSELDLEAVCARSSSRLVS